MATVAKGTQVPDLWMVSGTTPDGYISHFTNIHVTGAIPPERQEAALSRIVCLYVVSNLNDKR